MRTTSRSCSRGASAFPKAILLDEGLMGDRQDCWLNRRRSVQLWNSAWVACALSAWPGCGEGPSDRDAAVEPAKDDRDDDRDDDDDRQDPPPAANGKDASAQVDAGRADAGTGRDRDRSDSGARSDGSIGAKEGGVAVDGSSGSLDAGSADSGGAVSSPSDFKRGCRDLDPGPCASFIPGGPYGSKELELGSYGASMDYNVGKSFAYPIAAGDADNDLTCGLISGGQTSMMPKGPQAVDYSVFSVYRPGRYNEGEKLPIIVWGNGTCAWPEAYGPLLRYVASHGFFIVAANSRWVGDGVALKKALDFAFAANDDASSPYYGKLDTSKVGVMGHSQGSSGTANVASDPRVKAVILWNGGASASKPFLAVTGDGDIGNPSPSSMRSALEGARVDGAFLFYHMILQKSDSPGHLTLVTQPERVVEPAVAWWKYILSGDAASKEFFVGTNCKLCNRMAEFEFGQKGLD